MSVSFANQLTPNNFPTNARAVVDNNFVQVVALPNQGNTINTNAIDLLQATPYSVTEIVNVQLIVGAATGTANNGNMNAVLQQTSANTDGTANSAAWANITYLANPLITVADSGGLALTTANIKLAPGNLRFIRAQFKGDATVGNPTGNGTLQLLF